MNLHQDFKMVKQVSIEQCLIKYINRRRRIHTKKDHITVQSFNRWSFSKIGHMIGTRQWCKTNRTTKRYNRLKEEEEEKKGKRKIIRRRRKEKNNVNKKEKRKEGRNIEGEERKEKKVKRKRREKRGKEKEGKEKKKNRERKEKKEKGKEEEVDNHTILNKLIRFNCINIGH